MTSTGHFASLLPGVFALNRDFDAIDKTAELDPGRHLVVGHDVVTLDSRVRGNDDTR